MVPTCPRHIGASLRFMRPHLVVWGEKWCPSTTPTESAIGNIGEFEVEGAGGSPFELSSEIASPRSSHPSPIPSSSPSLSSPTKDSGSCHSFHSPLHTEFAAILPPQFLIPSYHRGQGSEGASSSVPTLPYMGQVQSGRSSAPANSYDLSFPSTSNYTEPCAPQDLSSSYEWSEGDSSSPRRSSENGSHLHSAVTNSASPYSSVTIPFDLRLQQQDPSHILPHQDEMIANAYTQPTLPIIQNNSPVHDHILTDHSSPSSSGIVQARFDDNPNALQLWLNQMSPPQVGDSSAQTSTAIVSVSTDGPDHRSSPGAHQYPPSLFMDTSLAWISTDSHGPTYPLTNRPELLQMEGLDATSSRIYPYPGGDLYAPDETTTSQYPYHHQA